MVNDLGLAAQRNVGVRAVPDADVIFFFDDDAVVRADYVERAVAVFAAGRTSWGSPVASCSTGPPDGRSNARSP